MGFVHPDKPDIFISYARGDDQADDEGEAGWVTTIKRLLEKRLFRPLGQNCDVWMDHRLATGADLPAELEAKVRASAILLIVLSPGYLASSWCEREMELFLDEAANWEHRTSSRVFVVEIEWVESPEAVRGVLRLPFWVTNRDKPNETLLLGSPRPNPADPDHKPYYTRLNSLVCDLAAELKRLKAAVRAALGERTAPHPAPEPRATVFLARATEDVDDPYLELRGYLTQAGFRVVPQGDYPRDEPAFRNAALADLKESVLFVQLLGSLPGRRLEKSAQGYVDVQHKCALKESPRGGLLRWRSPDLKPDQVLDAAHRDRLNEADVLAMPLLGFKELIMQRLANVLKPTPEPIRRPEMRLNKLVFVNADEPDLDLAEQLRGALGRIGAWAVLPYEIRQADNPREYLTARIKECDAFFVVYGNTRDTWVNGQFRLSRHALLERGREVGVALVEAPPVPKDPLSLHPPNLKVFHGEPLPSDVELLDYLCSL
jgi:hypothetical protein